MKRLWLAAMSVLVALSLALGIGGMASAQPADNASSKARGAAAGLTAEQRKEFVAGARKVAGLTDAQISAALKNPAALRGIPVRVQEIRTAPKSSEQSRSQDSQIQSTVTPYCATITGGTTYSNVYRQPLASFKVSRRWCWDYSTVTSVSVPTVTGTVTQTGAAGGWRYKGLTGSSDSFITYNNRVRGGHVSYRRGSFTACTYELGCYLFKAPWVKSTVYYNGTAQLTNVG